MQSQREVTERDTWRVLLGAARINEPRLGECSRIIRPLLVPQRFGWAHMGSFFINSLIPWFSVPEFQRVVHRVSSDAWGARQAGTFLS